MKRAKKDSPTQITMSFSLSENEKRLIQDAAEQRGMSVSALIRQAVFPDIGLPVMEAIPRLDAAELAVIEPAQRPGRRAPARPSARQGSLLDPFGEPSAPRFPLEQTSFAIESSTPPPPPPKAPLAPVVVPPQPGPSPALLVERLKQWALELADKEPFSRTAFVARAASTGADEETTHHALDALMDAGELVKRGPDLIGRPGPKIADLPEPAPDAPQAVAVREPDHDEMRAMRQMVIDRTAIEPASVLLLVEDAIAKGMPEGIAKEAAKRIALERGFVAVTKIRGVPEEEKARLPRIAGRAWLLGIDRKREKATGKGSRGLFSKQPPLRQKQTLVSLLEAHGARKRAIVGQKLKVLIAELKKLGFTHDMIATHLTDLEAHGAAVLERDDPRQKTHAVRGEGRQPISSIRLNHGEGTAEQITIDFLQRWRGPGPAPLDGVFEALAARGFDQQKSKATLRLMNREGLILLQPIEPRRLSDDQKAIAIEGPRGSLLWHVSLLGG